LEAARSGARWNSFLLSRHYFDLIHSPLDSASLYEVFRIGQPPLAVMNGLFPLSYSGLLDGPSRSFASRSAEPLSEALRTRFFVEAPGVEGQPWATAAPQGPVAATYKVLEFSPNGLRVEVVVARPAYLYWADGYDPHWKAWVNGEEVPILRANGAFKAVPIGAGTSTVEFRYRPYAFLWAQAVFYGCAGVGLLALGSIVWPFRKPVGLHGRVDGAKPPA
jgi:hypothetical protein